MYYCFRKFFAIMFLLAAMQAFTACEAVAGAAPFSFDDLWFYRDGARVIPEIGRRWLTAVFDKRYISNANDLASTGDTDEGLIQKKARAVIKSHDLLKEYLYDPNLAEDACFFRMRDGIKPEEINRLINQLNQDKTFEYVHPTLVLNNKTFAFFNVFQIEWKSGIDRAVREKLLSSSHAVFDEKENRYTVNVTAIPFFRAINLLAEDIRVLRVTPYLLEINPSISTDLFLSMHGGNIGDSIPFTLTISFSERVSIDPSSLATLNLRPQELQKELFDCTFDPYDYTKAVSKSPIVITGRVRFYAPGEYTIPAVTINYSCPSCPSSTVRSIDTKPVRFKVSSIIPAEKSQNRLIVPTEPVNPDFRLAALDRQSLRYLWLAIIALAGFVLCASWLLFLRRKATTERARLKEERKRGDMLAEQLRVLLQSAPTPPHWSYLGEVGVLLRRYIVLHYGIDSKYQGGSGSQFMETVRGHIPEEGIDRLSAIFSAIDNCVSLEVENFQNIDRLQHDILEFINSTPRKNKATGNLP